MRENGWLDGFVWLAGHWPDDAWLLLDRSPFPPPNLYTIYRWRGGRWHVFVPEFSTNDSALSIEPWGRDGALMVRRERDAPPRMRGLGARAGVLPRLSAVPIDCENRYDQLGTVVTFADGSLMAEGRYGCEEGLESVLQRWSSPSSGPLVQHLPRDVDGGATSVLVSDIDGEAPNDVTVSGSEHHGPDREQDRAYLAHFDGRAWSRLAPPLAMSSVDSYRREADGTAWAVARGAEHDMLWRQATNGPWTPVALPVMCDPSDVSKTDDGTLWVRCWGPIRKEGDPGWDLTLLSTAVPSRVVELGAAASIEQP